MNRAKGLHSVARAYVSSRSLIKKQAGGGGVFDSSRVSSIMSTQLLYSFSFGESHLSKHNANTGSRWFAGKSQYEASLHRDFLARLWVADMRVEEDREKRKLRIVRARKNRYRTNALESQNSSMGIPYGRWLSGSSVSEDKYQKVGRPTLKQPPVSQSTTGYLAPDSPEEAQVAPLLARSNLLITRDIEWANLAFGFEQENRYAIVDICYPQSPVGFIREQSNLIARQLLRTRRPFAAFITDATGNKLFRVRRPFWWITSSIYAEVNGKGGSQKSHAILHDHYMQEVGVVHRRWHLWRRIYDLYLGNKQFAVVENPGFWNWTFTLKDIDGNVLAQIDRDWRGIGLELFTDAGQYAIRFGASDPNCKTGLATAVEDLEVVRPLTLSERAVTLALAISLDNDYFSRHGGWGVPFFVVGE